MSATASTNLTISPIGNKFLLEVAFAIPREDYSNVLPIFVIDESGSMRHSLDAVVSGTKLLLNGFLENNCPQAVVIRYHSSATSFTFHTLQEAQAFQARAQGMTNFPAALAETVKWLQVAHKTGKQPRVYLMTDGQNTVDGRNLNSAKVNFQNAVAKCAIPPTIDVIGFTSGHDVQFLNSLSQMTGEGTFQYAETESVLEEIIGNLSAVSANKRVVDVLWSGQKVRITAVRDDSGLFRGLQTVSQQPCNEAKLQIAGQKPIYVPMVRTELSDELRTRFQIKNIRDTLSDLAQRASCIRNNESRKQFDQDLRQVDSDIDGLIGSGDYFRDMSRAERRLVRQTHLEFKDIISQLYNARTRNLGTSELATLLSTASAHVTKTGLARKLQQRVLANASDNSREIARERGKTLTFDATDEDMSACMLSLENYQELAQNGDCLCLCLSVSRSQAAISDPSQVKIYKIQPSLISLDAFRDAVDMRLLEDNGTNVHGGFSRALGKSAKVIDGMARENINAVLPLYYDEPSWSVARLRLKEALSWMATITWNGWSFSQVEILPFMILAHALRQHNESPSEYTAQIISQLVKTCRAISQFGADSETLEVRLQAQITSFMNAPRDRTVDVVPSIDALIGAAYTLDPATYSDPNFQLYVWEEFFRRELRWQLKEVSETEQLRMIAAKLHIDLTTYTTLRITASSGGAEAAHMRQKMGLNSIAASSGSVERNELMWDAKMNILPGDIQQAQQVWLQVSKWFLHVVEMPPNEICLAVTVQNMVQATNSARREAIETGQYINPYNNPNSLIRGIADRAITHFREIEWNRYQAQAGKDAAQQFASTANIFQAAGLIDLKIKHFGDHNLPRFAHALFNGGPLFVQKLELLLSGVFIHEGKKVRILNYGWKDTSGPSRHWFFRWWQVARTLGETDRKMWDTVADQYKFGGYWDGVWSKYN